MSGDEKQAAPETTSPELPAVKRDSRGEKSEHRFVPVTYREGDRVVLPVTFTDGTNAEVFYSSQLEIAGLGVTPYGSGQLQGSSPTSKRNDVVARDFWVFYGDVEGVLAARNGGRPPRLMAKYRGVKGKTVGFWAFASDPDADYLGFQFGRWAVLVYDYAADGALAGAAMTDAERASWAANLSGRETAEGFLRLEGSEPLRLANAGEHAGPQLSFGSVEPARSFTLYPGRCTPHRDQTRRVEGKLVEWNRGFADWCLSSSMRAHATGSERFIDLLIRDLAVRDVALASG